MWFYIHNATKTAFFASIQKFHFLKNVEKEAEIGPFFNGALMNVRCHSFTYVVIYLLFPPRIRGVLQHVQNYFTLPSLDIHLKLEIVDMEHMSRRGYMAKAAFLRLKH